MSIKIMTQVWENGPESQGDLLVLLALADFADDAGNCFPSVATIAEKARVQERSAIRIIRRLEAAGYLKTVIGGGRHGCNQYRINPDPSVTLTESHPDPECTETLTLSARNPDPSVTRTVIEPSLEPSTIDQPAPDRDFDEFWSRWPLRRVNKQKARVSFNRLSKQNRADAISRVEDWARNWRAANPRATDIHPTSYLNGRRWEDDFGAASRFEADATVNRWRKLAGG